MAFRLNLRRAEWNWKIAPSGVLVRALTLNELSFSVRLQPILIMDEPLGS
eukprot:COSAG02_NODE_873_length_16302_cov_113.473616_3_plen_50_part_00